MFSVPEPFAFALGVSFMVAAARDDGFGGLYPGRHEGVRPFVCEHKTIASLSWLKFSK